MGPYDKYPRLFSLPFQISLEPTPQRRDFQRVALENMLAFNASVCLSAFYQHISKLEEDPDKEVPSDLQLQFELDQMSIGKWNAIARETSKFLEEKNITEGKIFWSPIQKLYHGANSKEWTNLVNKLISKRNEDAHGSEVYDEKKLKEELDDRQDMLIKLFDMLSFYNDSTLLVPISVELINRQMQRQVRVFEGLEETTRVTNTLPNYQSTGYVPLLHTPGIQNDSDKSPDLGKKVEILSLNPMISVQPYEQGMHLFIYSKTLNRKRGNLNYLGINKSVELKTNEKKDDSEGEYLSARSICHEFSKFRIRAEKEDLLDQKKPVLQLRRKFILSKGKDSVLKEDELSVKVTIENTGNNTAENVQIKMPIPLMAVAADDPRVKDDAFKIYLDSLSHGDTHSATLNLKATKGGQHEFPPFTSTYEYEDIKNNTVVIDPSQSLERSSEAPQAPAYFLEVLDPTDPNSMLPLVNINLEYSNLTPKVGTNFDLKVIVHNVGKSVARDVDVHIFPPEKMVTLVSGNTHWKGNLNPNQREGISFTMLPKSPGIFSMKMRDIHYFNLQGDEFKTQAYEDYKILIEEDAKATFQFKMEEYWKDLKLSDSESRDIGYMKQTEPYKSAIFKDKGEVGAQIELEVKIKIVREVISKIASDHPDPDFKIREFNGNPHKETDCNWFAYVYQEMPVLLLLKIDDDKRVVSLFFNDPKGNKALTWRGEFRQVIFKEIELEKIINKKAPNGEKEGINGLKKLLNENFNRIINSAKPRLKFREDFINAFGINDNQLSQFLHQENYFSLKIIFSSMQDDVLNRCKQIALKPFQDFYCVALDNKVSSIVCSFEQKYRMASSLRDNKKYKLVGQDWKELKKGQTATTSVAITTPRFSIKNDSEQFNNLPNIIQTFVKDCLDIQFDNLVNDKKKEYPWLKVFVENIQKNLQEINKPTIIIPEERKRENQKDFYEDGFSFLVDGGEDFLSTKFEFLRIDFNSIYVYIKTRYLDMYSCFDVLKQISQKENIKFSIVEKGPWQYEIQILASKINNLEFDEIIKKLLIPAVSNIGEKDLINPSFGVIRHYLNHPTWKGILKALLETEDGLSFDECDNILNELNEPKLQRGRPITAKFGGISREFSTRVTDNPLEIDYKNENLRIKPEYRTLIYEVDESLEEIEKNLSGIESADEDVTNEVPDDSISDKSQILSEDMDKTAVSEETTDVNHDIDQLEALNERG